MENEKKMTPKEIENKRADQLQRVHSYADDIERILRHILDLKYNEPNFDNDVEALDINAITLEFCPYLDIKCGLFYYLAKNPNKKNEIANFLNKYHQVNEMAMYDILSFVTSTEEVNGSTYTIDAENGEEYMIQMIRDCGKIVGYGKK